MQAAQNLKTRWNVAVSIASISALGFGRTSAAVPTCLDEICFVDRGASGEIVLGHIRGGLSVLDYDLDGYPDLFIGDNAGATNRLFHNAPDLARPGNRTFADVTVGSGIDDSSGTSSFSFGVVSADYDNDDDPDLYLTGGNQENGYGQLYRNDGAGHFTNISVAAGIRSTSFAPLSASWTDLDLDGDLDLMTVGEGGAAGSLRLLINNGNGTFTDAADRVPVVTNRGIAYANLWMDYNSDGYSDLVIPFTMIPMVLENRPSQGGGRVLVDVTQAVGFTHLGPAPMGIAAGDHDNDGDFDIAVTDAVRGTYYETRGQTMVEVFPMQTFFGWGVTWIDADNDGWLDNYQAGSHSTANFDRFQRNLGNSVFVDLSPVLNTSSLASQHTVQVDFNNDGRQDLITINPGTPNQTISVYENISVTQYHWLNLRLRGDGLGINRDAVGAIVEVQAAGLTQIRQVRSGSATTATEDMRLHFGLGGAKQVDAITIIWPALGPLSARTYRYVGPFDADHFYGIYAPSDDCNGNSSPDYFDIGQGFSLDCNETAVPDECEQISAGDFSGDGALTLADIRGIRICLNGPAQPPSPPLLACTDTCLESMDFDHDGDVDLLDIQTLQQMFMGP